MGRLDSNDRRSIPSPLWITDEAVAALLGVHRSTVWRWLDQELIPKPRRIGGCTRWLRDDIELFIHCRSLGEFHRRRRQAESLAND